MVIEKRMMVEINVGELFLNYVRLPSNVESD